MARDRTQDSEPAAGDDEAAESGKDIIRKDLDEKDQRIVEKHETASAKLVHEIIRQRGIDELERPIASLIWSAIGAGFVIGLSPYTMAIFAQAQPDASYLKLLLALGYSVGFIAVIAGRLQLFTESTITAVLPLATTPSWTNLLRTLRLWAVVFLGNILGTFLFALIVRYDVAHQPELAAIIHRQSVETITNYLVAPFWKGIPAGFMLAVVVWSTPNLEKQEMMLIVLVTGLMQLGEVGHSIAGSAEMWVGVLHGDFTPYQGILGFLVPAALGNLVGGAVLFALLAHAQVVPEIKGDQAGGSSSGDDNDEGPARRGRGR